MLGLSFGKLLVLLVVVWVAWRGLRIMGQMQRKLDEHQARQGQQPKPRPRPQVRATDLVECPRCGTYVPNGTICPSVEQCQFRRG